MSRTHLVIPDVQDRPGVPKDHLRWIGQYIVDRKPDVIVNLGDFADMESLCSYDKGKKCYEGRRYKKDIESVKEAMEVLMKPVLDYNKSQKRNKKQQYKPEMHMLYGNHCARITTAVELDPILEGTISLDDLEYEKYWQVHKFLDIVAIDGVHYSHYFYRPKSGHPYSGAIETRLKNIGFTFTQGHEQGKLVGSQELGNGEVRRGLVVGSCYLYDPDYRGPQATSDWRGVIVKHEVAEGNYDLMEVSLNFLCKKYEGMALGEFMRREYNKKDRPWTF